MVQHCSLFLQQETKKELKEEEHDEEEGSLQDGELGNLEAECGAQRRSKRQMSSPQQRQIWRI